MMIITIDFQNKSYLSKCTKRYPLWIPLFLISPPRLPCSPGESDEDDSDQQPREVAWAGFLFGRLLGDRLCLDFAAGAVLKSFFFLIFDRVGRLLVGVGYAVAVVAGDCDAFDGRQAGDGVHRTGCVELQLDPANIF